MSADIIFVHGWGMGPAFWGGIRAGLPEIQATTIDLEFIGTKQASTAATAREPAIYITHSLGTMWALKNHHHDMKALISINGFSCFQNFADERTLQTMKARLKRAPEKQMDLFWKSSDLPACGDLNVQKLEDGLEWLSSWDVKKELRNLTCPVMSLAGSNDSILPLDLMKEEWTGFDLRVHEDAGHALPLSNPDWCVNHIKDFIREL